MILTKKGSTRGNFQFLAALTIILLATRLLVQTIESAAPTDISLSVEWKQLPDWEKEELREHIEFRDFQLPSKSSEEKKSEPDKAKKKKIKSKNRSSFFKSIHLKEVLTDNIDQKPILFLVTDENNPACEYLHRVTLTNPKIVSYIENNFYPVKLNLDHVLNYTEYAFNSTYANSFFVFVPYIVVIDCEGKRVNRNTSNFDCVGLQDFLKASLKRIEENKNR